MCWRCFSKHSLKLNNQCHFRCCKTFPTPAIDSKDWKWALQTTVIPTPTFPCFYWTLKSRHWTSFCNCFIRAGIFEVCIVDLWTQNLMFCRIKRSLSPRVTDRLIRLFFSLVIISIHGVYGRSGTIHKPSYFCAEQFPFHLFRHIVSWSLIKKLNNIFLSRWWWWWWCWRSKVIQSSDFLEFVSSSYFQEV